VAKEPGVRRGRAKREREMKSLGKYVRKRKLEVNAEKTKMMVFNKSKRRGRNEWKWEEVSVRRRMMSRSRA
jgi:hypothetical protein